MKELSEIFTKVIRMLKLDGKINFITTNGGSAEKRQVKRMKEVENIHFWYFWRSKWGKWSWDYHRLWWYSSSVGDRWGCRWWHWSGSARVRERSENSWTSSSNSKHSWQCDRQHGRRNTRRQSRKYVFEYNSEHPPHEFTDNVLRRVGCSCFKGKK